MAQTVANGLQHEYELDGPADGPVVLLIMGLGGQLTLWPRELVDRLTAKGFRVLRYDGRDAGLSEKLDDAGVPDLAAVLDAVRQGQPAPVTYRLEDLAADAAGLLDALGIRAAHVAGGSMGGMVAQLVAIHHPDRVLSLTSMMSTSANPDLPGPAPELVSRLMQPPPDPAEDLTGYVDHLVTQYRLSESPAYPMDEAALRAQITGDFHRSFHPVGTARLYAAVQVAADRRPLLGAVRVPALVLHGAEDPVIPLAAGQDTADHLPDAEFLVIPGMGHNFPPEVLPTVVDAVEAVATRARTS